MTVFRELRERMLRSSVGMNVAQNGPGNVILKAPWNERGKKDAAWFGVLQLKKNYVSLHLMPLYALPSLRRKVSPELQRRMQGKSCFNFKKAEPDLFDASERLISECAIAYSTAVSAEATRSHYSQYRSK